MRQQENAHIKTAVLAQWQRDVGKALSAAEWLAVQGAAHGMENEEIAGLSGKSSSTIRTQLRLAARKLRPYASGADVLTLSRTGMAVICVRAMRYAGTPRPQLWGRQLGRTLGQSGVELAHKLVRAGSWSALRKQVAADSVDELYRRVSPFVDLAVLPPTPVDLIELLICSGVVQGRHAFDYWAHKVESSVTPSQQEVLEWVRKGLTNREIAAEMKIRSSVVKRHIEGVIVAFTPYSALAGVVLPVNRTSAAVISMAADATLRP